MLFFAVAILATPVSAALARGDHPAVKIIALLEKLSAQVKEEGEAEAVEYAAFTQWCANLQREKTAAVEENTKTMEVATATISALTQDMAALEREIEEIDADITASEASKTAAASERATQNTEFIAAKTDLEGTITAIGDAIASIESSKPAFAQAAVKKSMELLAIYMPQAKAVRSFLQRRENQEPPARVYDFKGGNVIDLLKNLKLKFEDDLKEAESSETNAANAQTLSDAAKQDAIDAATRAKETKTSISGRKGQEKAQSESDLTEATDAKTSAASVLATTKSTCTTRASEWEERSGRRAAERKAMGEAIEVLQKVTGVRSPESKGVAITGFLQKADDPTAKIVNLLRTAAGKTKAKELLKLADAIAALSAQTPGSGAFDSIKNMIQKMIFHLMAEQKDEDDHKNWCDMELQKTDLMIADKTTRRDQLQSDIDSLTAKITELEEGITANTQSLSELATQIEENTDTRNAERTENAATMKDAQDAQSAIDQAIAVLSEFYKSTGGIPKEEWELMQMRTARRVGDEPEPVPFEGTPYTGTEGGSGVVDMLTNIAADFASMESEARSDETQQQDEFDTWLTSAKIDQAGLEKDTEMKSSRKSRASGSLEGKSGDADHNSKELDATNKYLENLQPACVDGDSSYEDRKQARTDETEALRQAQGILEDAFASVPEATE